MNQFNIDKWITTTPQDLAHAYECACDFCHQIHRQDKTIVEGCESCEMVRAERTARTGDPMNPWTLEFKATAEGVTMFEGEREIGVIYYPKDAQRILDILKSYPHLVNNVRKARKFIQEREETNINTLSNPQKQFLFETNYLLETMQEKAHEAVKEKEI